jgi:hypothetical protein
MFHNGVARQVFPLRSLLIFMMLILGISVSTTAQTPLYQLHKDGKIWRFTGTACQGSSCPGWQMLDNNAATGAIVADGTRLYQLHKTGRIFRFTGTACNGDHCPGWQMLDNNAATKSIVAAGGKLFQLHTSGRIWQYTNQPCSGDNCFGWQMLDNNPNSIAIAADTAPQIVSPFTATGPPVTPLLYQLHKNGMIFRFTGTTCNGEDCPGWQMLDNNPATKMIVAGGGQLYQMHKDGKIFRYTNTPCNDDLCPGWEMLHNDPRNTLIVSDGTRLYRLHVAASFQHAVRTIWRFTGPQCSGTSCPGWQMLSRDTLTSQIAGRTDLYRMLLSGHIFRFNGTPCSGNTCPGWQMLDNNPNTRAIASR